MYERLERTNGSSEEEEEEEDYQPQVRSGGFRMVTSVNNVEPTVEAEGLCFYVYYKKYIIIQ
jgi:hypothetical protein